MVLGALLVLSSRTPLYSAGEGYILLKQGTVKLMRSGQSHILSQPDLKLKLFPGDRLHTGSDTRVEIALKQGAEIIELFSHAFFEVEEFSEEQRNVALLVGKGNFEVLPLSEQKKSRLAEETESDDLKSGQEEALSAADQKSVLEGISKLAKLGERSLGGLKRRKKRFKVRTVSAIVGVRGTDFVVATTPDTTNVLTVEGEVTMASPEVPGYEVAIPENSISRVSEGKAPSTPVVIPPAEQKQIVEGEGGSVFNAVEFGPAQSIEMIRQEASQIPGEEDNILDQIGELDEIQDELNRFEDAISGRTRTLIIKTNITNR